MNRSKKFLAVSALALGVSGPMSSFAQSDTDPASAVAAKPASALSEGEIRRLDPESGKVDFACLHVGHYEAGMKGQVSVGK